MPLDTFATSELAVYPRGREYTYLVDVTGCPYVWSDGKGTWTAPLYGQTVIHGGLATTDWTFDFVGDPLSPLDVGGGLTITLHDEASARTRKFFAPNYDGGFGTRLNGATVAPGDIAVTVEDSSGFAVNDIVYVGLEAIAINNIASGTSIDNVTRGMYGSVAREYRLYDGGNVSVGARMTLSPRAHRGRYASIWIAALEDDGTVGDAYRVWAGRLASVDFEQGMIRLSCDNLLAAITKEDWPQALPSGHFGTTSPTFYLTKSDLTLKLSAWTADTSNTFQLGTVGMGYIDTGGTFNELPNTDGWFTLEQIARYLTDTVHYKIQLAGDIIGGTTQDEEMSNNFSIVVEADSDGRFVDLVCRNDTSVGVTFDKTIGVVAKLIASTSRANTGAFSFAPRYEGWFWRARRSGLFFSKEADQIEYYPDNASDPLFIEGCYDVNLTATVGYARIYNGETFELISFSGTTTGTDGRVRLTGVKRGLGGTAARAWGDDPTTDAEDETNGDKTMIAQVWMIDHGESRPVHDFILPALLSTGAYQANSDHDTLGARLGLGIPAEFVAYEEIIDKIAALGLDAPRSFWVTDVKKGKEDMASFLQANGIHFITKRFRVSVDKDMARSWYNYFGISIANIDAVSRSTYTRTITDADRAAGTRVSTDFNERLIINTVRLAPFWYFNKSADEDGGFIYAHAEESIADYGATKTLEIKPSALYSMVTAGGQTYSNSTDAYTGLATKVGLRWFGTYANGSYLLTLETPHTGWRFQPGTSVNLTLTGVTGPEAEESLSSLGGRVMEVKHRHGANPGATVVLRLGYGRASEMAPCMRATTHSGGTTLTCTRYYSSTDQDFPYESLEPRDTTTDSLWFDHTEHGGNFKVWCWEIGDYAGGQERTVTSVTHGSTTSTVVISVALSAALQTAATNDRLVITFAEYTNASTLSKLFAYIGANGYPALLNGTDEAAEWS